MARLRDPSKREFVALIFGFTLSPLAFAAVSAFDAWAAITVCRVAGVSLDPPDQELLFMFARNPFLGLFGGYLVAALVVFPPIILLRVRGWLRASTVIGAACWIPLTGAASMSLLFGSLAGVSQGTMLMMFAFLAYLLVPGAVATAVAFWIIYRSIGRRSPERLDDVFGLDPLRST